MIPPMKCGKRWFQSWFWFWFWFWSWFWFGRLDVEALLKPVSLSGWSCSCRTNSSSPRTLLLANSCFGPARAIEIYRQLCGYFLMQLQSIISGTSDGRGSGSGGIKVCAESPFSRGPHLRSREIKKHQPRVSKLKEVNLRPATAIIGVSCPTGSLLQSRPEEISIKHEEHLNLLLGASLGRQKFEPESARKRKVSI